MGTSSALKMRPSISPTCDSIHMSTACRFDQWTAYGKVGGLDDPSMGWARYAQVTTALATFCLTDSADGKSDATLHMLWPQSASNLL